MRVQIAAIRKALAVAERARTAAWLAFVEIRQRFFISLVKYYWQGRVGINLQLIVEQLAAARARLAREIEYRDQVQDALNRLTVQCRWTRVPRQ